MPKYVSIPAQVKSDECPAVPRGVRVWGDHEKEGTKNDQGAAVKVLAKALADDSKLDKEHPEFLSPKDSSQTKSKSEERRVAIQKSGKLSKS